MIGSTGKAEPGFLRAVTGRTISFLKGIQLGRKIWNLDHAIWTLQGRHRDMVQFADYVYTIPNERKDKSWTMYKDGKWAASSVGPRVVDRQQFEEFKTVFYELQGWDPSSGYPRRSTLTSLGLGCVADELDKAGRLGQE
jgi:aldehyde:ferredoxin oxidoreductase